VRKDQAKRRGKMEFGCQRDGFSLNRRYRTNRVTRLGDWVIFFILDSFLKIEKVG
jgi:hypothetical protein